MRTLVFEDAGVARLRPITIARPAYAIACGSFRLIELLAGLGGELRAAVRPHLRAIQRQDFPEFSQPWAGAATAGSCLLVNARLVPSWDVRESLRRLVAEGRPGWVGQAGMEGPTDAGSPPGTVAAAVLDARQQLQFDGELAKVDGRPLAEWLSDPAGYGLPRLDAELPLFSYPHDVVAENLRILGGNLERRLEQGEYRQVLDGVFLAPDAVLGQHVVTDTHRGPIVVEQGASIGPYCYLSGPAHLGRNARVIEHAAIKDAVTIGHTTKIGGEVEASIIEPFTNKQHHGFLGHSYLGSWINLGAGTCNSDLKNTYGHVKMDYGGEKVDTQMQFVGCILGDYSKSAINTGIFTGKTIGVCSMVYGFVTTNVPSFVNYARLFGQVTELPPEVMVSTQQRMFSRRNVVQRSCDIQLIHDMYHLTREDRQLAGEPLAL